MRRVLVLTGFLLLAAAAVGVFLAATRTPAEPAPATAATRKPAHHRLVAYRHSHGHSRAHALQDVE